MRLEGPRVRGREAAYEHAVGRIREGWLLHERGRGEGAAPEDRDHALLLGDRLYAEGLLGLVALEDLHAVGVLADVISGCAAALAGGDPARAEGAWEAGARAVAAGEPGAGALPARE